MVLQDRHEDRPDVVCRSKVAALEKGFGRQSRPVPASPGQSPPNFPPETAPPGRKAALPVP